MRRRTMLKGAGVALLGTSIASGRAGATDSDCDAVVDASGSGDFQSIQAAVHAVEQGSRICVQPGVYEEQVFVDTDDLTFVGDPGAEDEVGVGPNAPIIDGGSVEANGAAAFRAGGTSGTTIKGFEVRNFQQEPWAAGIRPGSADATVTDNYVHGIRTTGIARPGWGQVDPSGYTVARNRVTDVGEIGIRLDNVSDTVVKNNIVEGSSGENDDEETAPKLGINIHSNVGNNTMEGDEATSVDNSGVRVEGNLVSGNFWRAGIWVLSINRNKPENPPDTHAILRDVTVVGNTIRDNQIELAKGISILSNPEGGDETRLENVEVRGNEISNVSNASNVWSGEGATLQDVRYVGNDIRDNEYGIAIWEDADGSEVSVHKNNIVGNEEWGLGNATESTVSAERNYWGAANGPNRETPGNGRARVGDGDRVEGPVDVTPWEPNEI